MAAAAVDPRVGGISYSGGGVVSSGDAEGSISSGSVDGDPDESEVESSSAGEFDENSESSGFREWWEQFERTMTRVGYGLLGSFVVVAAAVAGVSATRVRRSVLVANDTTLSVPYCSRMEQMYLPDDLRLAAGCPTSNELFLDEEVIPNDSELYDPPSSMPWFLSPLSVKLVRPPSRDVFSMISNSLAMLIVLYVIYVLPLLASSDQDQAFRFRSYQAYPYNYDYRHPAT